MKSAQSLSRTKSLRRLKVLLQYMKRDYRQAAKRAYQKRKLAKEEVDFIETELGELLPNPASGQFSKRILTFFRKIEQRQKLPMMFRSLNHIYRDILK